MSSLLRGLGGTGLATFQITDNDHGRLEVRRHWVSHDLGWLSSDWRFAGEPAIHDSLASLALVKAQVTRDAKTTKNRRYYLASAQRSLERFAQAVGAHWAIENSLH